MAHCLHDARCTRKKAKEARQGCGSELTATENDEGDEVKEAEEREEGNINGSSG
jgi:hypothetical protein